MAYYPTAPTAYIPPVQCAVTIPVPLSAPVVQSSADIICPSCNYRIGIMKVERGPTIRTYLLTVGLCLVFIPCVVLPWCFEWGYKTKKYCPSCNKSFGYSI